MRRLLMFKRRLRLEKVEIIAMLAGLLLLAHIVTAFSKSPVGKRWSQTKLIAIDRVDHSSFDALLKKYVDEDGYVNYSAWKKSAVDRSALQSYLASLGQAGPRIKANREAELAYWINAYNALTIEGMLQVYPTDSIRKHTAKIVGYNIWKDLPLIVGGRQYSLEQIEHEVLRKKGEPRIHFAIVCASVGCPRLRNEAYVADRLEEQLADNARDFFSRSNNFRFDKRRGTIQVSAILDWFGKDFGGNQVEQFYRLKPYLPQQAQTLAVNPRTRVSFLRYDWSINDQARRPRTAARSKFAR